MKAPVEARMYLEQGKENAGHQTAIPSHTTGCAPFSPCTRVVERAIVLHKAEGKEKGTERVLTFLRHAENRDACQGSLSDQRRWFSAKVHSVQIICRRRERKKQADTRDSSVRPLRRRQTARQSLSLEEGRKGQDLHRRSERGSSERWVQVMWASRTYFSEK